jgi:hypothetical protein
VSSNVRLRLIIWEINVVVATDFCWQIGEAKNSHLQIRKLDEAENRRRYAQIYGLTVAMEEAAAGSGRQMNKFTRKLALMYALL